jgi:hypothetical protein
LLVQVETQLLYADVEKKNSLRKKKRLSSNFRHLKLKGSNSSNRSLSIKSKVRWNNGYFQKNVLNEIRFLMLSKREKINLQNWKRKPVKLTIQIDLKIEDSKEIVGIYGWKDNHKIAQLCFLIWTPPKL